MDSLAEDKLRHRLLRHTYRWLVAEPPRALNYSRGTSFRVLLVDLVILAYLLGASSYIVAFGARQSAPVVANILAKYVVVVMRTVCPVITSP
jgi:hypothetical protein